MFNFIKDLMLFLLDLFLQKFQIALRTSFSDIIPNHFISF